ncbi:tyrosine-protein kinase STYK1 [Neoarius graeffei]|uniref:tyrosine-protein kinase STYK1 n=1 Tax=Neoarius graeffei TaxID=443677 RepID=UPI00298CED5F|nr:tyrosine-protein kinase STYK1 [Neoarius graeffei]XP_060793457.1 tyrosine-protein kinase STYK1 [Neoarius graeffei]
MDVQVTCNVSSLECGQLALIIIPSLLALSTLIIVTQIIWSFLKKKSSVLTSSVVSFDRNGLLPGHNALSSWEMPTHCILEEVEFLKNGRYGDICKGQLKRDGVATAVIIKMFKGSPNNHEAKVFVDLALFYSAVCKHDNLVRMLYCQTQRSPMYLVFERSTPGNLLHFLWSLREGEGRGTCHQEQSFSERSVYLVAKQVATGLDYLLSEHRLVHGNIAACNMLIGSGLLVKVSGLALAFESRKTETETAGKEGTAGVPLKWQAPERLFRLPVTARSDVWSFGVLLYELITLGAPPFPELEPSETFLETLANYKLKRPPNCGGALFDLMKYCCMWNFKDRPAYSAIIRLLESYIHLANTKPLSATQHMDISEYRRKAGVPS